MTPTEERFTGQTRRKLCTIVIAAIMCGCGGGGGSNAKFAGVWDGSVSLVDDGCGVVTQDQSFLSFSHLVNQDGDSIVLDNGAMEFSGSVTGDNSFSVAASRQSRINPECNETITWRYEQVQRDQALFVVRTSQIVCPDGNTCTFTFSGQGFRNGGGPITIDTGVGGVPSQGDAGELPEAAL